MPFLSRASLYGRDGAASNSTLKAKSTVILFLILAALAAYLAWVELPGQRKAEDEERLAQRIVAFEPEAVTELSIRYPTSEIKMTRITENWKIHSPLEYPADAREVETFIATLTDQSATRVLEEAEPNLADYGLDAPAIDIEFGLAGNRERVLVGSEGSLPNTLFLRRESDGKILITPAWIKGSLTRKPYDFRDKKVVRFDRAEVTHLQLKFSKNDYLLESHGGVWTGVRPRPFAADPDVVGNILLALENMRASGFIDLPAEKAAIDKLQRRTRASVILRTADREITVRFVEPEKASTDGADPIVYALPTEEGPYFELPAANLSEFKDSIFHYTDKRLAQFEPTQIDQIVVRSPDDRYILTRAGQIWALDGNASGVNGVLVTRFLDDLHRLKAEEPADRALSEHATGLSPARIEIELGTQGRSLLTIEIGEAADQLVYARGPKPSDVVKIRRGFLDNIPTRQELLPGSDPNRSEPATAPAPP